MHERLSNHSCLHQDHVLFSPNNQTPNTSSVLLSKLYSSEHCILQCSISQPITVYTCALLSKNCHRLLLVPYLHTNLADSFSSQVCMGVHICIPLKCSTAVSNERQSLLETSSKAHWICLSKVLLTRDKTALALDCSYTTMSCSLVSF